jgi:hypothetical protein
MKTQAGSLSIKFNRPQSEGREEHGFNPAAMELKEHKNSSPSLRRLVTPKSDEGGGEVLLTAD